jgi:hypothetical protein
MHVAPTDALTFLRGLSEKSVDLLLTDPALLWHRQG